MEVFVEKPQLHWVCYKEREHYYIRKLDAHYINKQKNIYIKIKYMIYGGGHFTVIWLLVSSLNVFKKKYFKAELKSQADKWKQSSPRYIFKLE